jgi:MEDS: MEthanogen/methylotroph, DcmR Sensory domain
VQSASRRAGELSESELLAPGSHACVVVESPTRFEQWTAACLAEGVRRQEKPLRFGLQTDPVTKANDVSLPPVDPRVAVFAGGPVDPKVMDAMLRKETATARSGGYQGLRLVADMDWLLALPPSRAEVAAFELLLDEVVADLGITVACAYRTARFDAITIAEVAAVHPLTLGTPPIDLGFRLWNVAGGTWEVSGEVDHSNAEPFRRALTTAASRSSSLWLRVAGLRFMAVAGIQAIVHVARTRPDLRLMIEDASSLLRRCWMLLDLHKNVSNVKFRTELADERYRTGAGTAAGTAEDPG